MANKSKQIGVRGKILHSQAQEIVANVIEFMTKEAKNGVTIPLSNFKERILAATKIGEFTYRKVISDMKEISQGKATKFSSPRKNKNRPNPKSNLYQGELEQIKSIIHNFYIIEKRVPTLKGIHNKILQYFKGGHSTLGKIIKKLGLRWRWCNTVNKRKVLMESYDIRLKRIQYLRQLQQCIQDKRQIIFTDESYINICHTNPKNWTDNSTLGFKKPIDKGPRVIMVHVGGSEGSVNNALLMFKSVSTSGDYHNDMNHTNFMQWVQKQLLPNIPKRAALVIDNASHHNMVIIKDPASMTKKDDMIMWLHQHSITHDPLSTKPVLYAIIKEHKYILDTELAKHDHIVLRLPPYHPELNPIEKIWTAVKQYVASRNTTFKLKDVIKLTEEKFVTITPEDWVKICTHVDKVVEEYKYKEHMFDESYDDFRFVVNTGDSDESTEECSDDEDEGDLGISLLPDSDLQQAGPSTE